MDAETILPPSESPTEENQNNYSSVSSLTEEQMEEIITLLTKVSERDYSELIGQVGYQNEIVVEHAQLQSDLLGYATGFLCFFAVVALCTYVYKFFRLFF